jgi:L-asparaginase II
MLDSKHLPLYELTRGEIVESIHWGSIAVSDRQGQLVAWYGDPNSVTFLRSSAKPFQALPFIEAKGDQRYNLESSEIALLCASHSGTDVHIEQLRILQEKTGIEESNLSCGVHPPLDKTTDFDLRKIGQPLTPNRHNCSGKHTGMLAYASMQNWPTESYTEPIHPVQNNILQVFSEMCGAELSTIHIGIDGCSATNFAVPLKNTAIAYACLCDPGNFSASRMEACNIITSAMMDNPFLVGGPNRFDTDLMEATSGRIVSKEGAEGYQAMGIMPGAMGAGSPALGIAVKIADGDLTNRARPAVALEVLSQLNVLSRAEKHKLANYGPTLFLKNYRNIETGVAKPVFNLIKMDSR